MGHSYNGYVLLIGGAASLPYEGCRRGSPRVSVCECYGVRTMLSAPTAIHVLKKQGSGWLRRYDLSRLSWLFLTREALDRPTAQWIGQRLGVPVLDHCWQAETGGPAITLMPGLDLQPIVPGSPVLSAPGSRVKVVEECSGIEKPPGERGVQVLESPLPPGCPAAVWRDEARYRQSYVGHFDRLLRGSRRALVEPADSGDLST